MSEKTTERRFLGCGDNSCIFERPSVGTNGGCRCFNDIEDRAVRHRVRQAAQRQRQQIIALTSERDEAVRVAGELRTALEVAEVKAAFAEEIRRKRNHAHTVYWWAEYLEEFDRRYDSLTASTGGSSDEPQKEIRE